MSKGDGEAPPKLEGYSLVKGKKKQMKDSLYTNLIPRLSLLSALFRYISKTSTQIPPQARPLLIFLQQNSKEDIQGHTGNERSSRAGNSHNTYAAPDDSSLHKVTAHPK
mmetsp:Transcript_9601/g.35954  ORF Transcript_9601/g.35954 Transcript_9601/m.35954 type:complete len:109 (+) Transcript_9601:366-692(+)|eukprot:scaffold927_cov230-Pinguiococcus_pyrenoidosus.AAC.5